VALARYCHCLYRVCGRLCGDKDSMAFCMKELFFCFLAGASGMLCMFILICFIPEIEEFLNRKK